MMQLHVVVGALLVCAAPREAYAQEPQPPPAQGAPRTAPVLEGTPGAHVDARSFDQFPTATGPEDNRAIVHGRALLTEKTRYFVAHAVMASTSVVAAALGTAALLLGGLLAALELPQPVAMPARFADSAALALVMAVAPGLLMVAGTGALVTVMSAARNAPRPTE